MDELKHITEEVVEELRGIQEFLEEEYTDDPVSLLNRITLLNVYMARSGFLLAEAEADRDKAMAATFAEHASAITKMPSQVSQKFINALCEKENYFVTWIERIHRTCVHQSDGIRTQVSFAKEEMRMAGWGNNG